MNAIPYKAKQFLLVLLKLLIVCGAVAFLYAQLKTKDLSDWHLVTQKFTFLSFLGILFLSFLNWLLECLKWKNLVSGFKKITFKKAVEQTLGSLTASIFTPNRIGEYVAKGMYYSKEQTKKIIFLNFLGNSVQMLVTLFFGLIGCVFFFVLSPNLFEENYYTERLRIPVADIKGFQLFCVDDADFAVSLNSKNKTMSMFLITDLARKYLTILENEK